MQQHSENAKEQNDQVIHQFIEGFLDTGKKEPKYLKRMNQSCQKMIEERISQTPDLKHLLSLYKNSPWIQKLLVSHVLLKMYHQAALWGIETLEPKTLEVQYKRHFYLNRRPHNVPKS
jgi:hypothetical protein